VRQIGRDYPSWRELSQVEERAQARYIVAMRSRPLPSDLQCLLEAASSRPLTAEQRERQVISLAFGNVKLENDRITRPLVVDAVRRTVIAKR
jgi:hypothetical protein